MENSEKIFTTVLICCIAALIAGISIFIVWQNEPEGLYIKKSKIIFNGDGFSSLYIAADDKAEVPDGTEFVVVTGNFCIDEKHFADLTKIKKIYFCNKRHRIEARLFDKLKHKIVIEDKGKIIIEIQQ